MIKHVRGRLTIAAIVLVLAVALPALASADETPETRTVELQPGDNFVGWVGEVVSVAELFAEIPEVEAVYSWDARWRRWSMAAPAMPERLWTLHRIVPGAAYLVRLGDGSHASWNRPNEPAAGSVSLHSGGNWVAWLGPDDWSIADVARGIGSSLLSIRSGDLIYDPSNPETMDDWPVVQRGDALEVRVSRDVNWLQPTFVVPEIHYAGNVDHGVRRLIEHDLAATLDYSARELGVQADPFSLVVVVAGDAKSAHEKTNELGHPWDWESFRNFWQRAGGWYSSDQDAFYLKSDSWEGNRSGRYHEGRYVVLHEYIHALQYQLMGDNYTELNWLLEGSANWFDSDLATQDRNGNPLSRKLIDALNQASKGPRLEEIESPNDTWQYSFGLVAADQLIERAGKGAALDFYRVLAPGRAGPGGHWETRPTMRSAFSAAFGLTLEEFYDEFEALMTKRRGSATRRPAGNEFALEGTRSSTPTARRGSAPRWKPGSTKTAHPAGWDRRATSGEDGTFEVFVRRRADYRIWIELSEDAGHCQYWWSEDSEEPSPSEDDASLIEIGSSQPESITITVDADRCRWQISGSLSGPDDLPLAGLQVRAHGDGSATPVRTELDGSFSFVATRPGAHQLSVFLGGCRLYRGADGLAGTEQHAASDSGGQPRHHQYPFPGRRGSLYEDHRMVARSGWRGHQEQPGQCRRGRSAPGSSHRLHREIQGGPDQGRPTVRVLMAGRMPVVPRGSGRDRELARTKDHRPVGARCLGASVPTPTRHVHAAHLRHPPQRRRHAPDGRLDRRQRRVRPGRRLAGRRRLVRLRRPRAGGLRHVGHRRRMRNLLRRQ